MSAVAELPSVSDARLPVTYEAARRALAECERIDECKNWVDKAQALASYAKQANDDSLRKYALRIQARASRRAGQLYQEIEPAYGANQNIKDGGVPNVVTRKAAAEEAGLSERQCKTINRIANIPEEDFEAVIESEHPPTLTALAERGKIPRMIIEPPPKPLPPSRPLKPLVDLDGIDPGDFARATEARGSLKRLAEFCDQHDAGRIARAFQPHEITPLRQHIDVVTTWLARFANELPE